jgi:hypothetical protein
VWLLAVVTTATVVVYLADAMGPAEEAAIGGKKRPPEASMANLRKKKKCPKCNTEVVSLRSWQLPVDWCVGQAFTAT